MRTPPTHRQPRLFQPLEQTDFARLRHAASLKGLLQPFKGKGELLLWAGQCDALQADLTGLAQRLLTQAAGYPFSLLPVGLVQQNTGAGTAFLRWRNADRSAMGVSLWERLISRRETPESLIKELYELELQRITLNMQISALHSIARQSRECAIKIQSAEEICAARSGTNHGLSNQEHTS